MIIQLLFQLLSCLIENDRNQITEIIGLVYIIYHSPRSNKNIDGGVGIIFKSNYVIYNII